MTEGGKEFRFEAINEVGGYGPVDVNYREIPHFRGCPVPDWATVFELESTCKRLAESGVSYGQAEAAIVQMLNTRNAGVDIAESIKQLSNTAATLKESTIFGPNISARQARRAGQAQSFTKQLKKNFNGRRKESE